MKSTTRVKTGCATCRIRRVKCDEAKPSCNKCLSTGRVCDGYESPFRVFSYQSAGKDDVVHVKRPIRPVFATISLPKTQLLSRCFSTKSMLGVDLGCDEEANQILNFCTADSSIQYAVTSLISLRENAEVSGVVSMSNAKPDLGQEYGLSQYCMAMQGLASNLSSPSPKALRSALLCCQVFISIEQVRGNYAAMAQHFILGLGIMRQYRSRPSLDANHAVIRAYPDPLPLIDVFVIKLFAAPCKFVEPRAQAGKGQAATTTRISDRGRDNCPLAPDMRAELVRIAVSTLQLLNNISRVELATDAIQLLDVKASLLSRLESWLTDLNMLYRDINTEPITISVTRFFHGLLKLVLLGALSAPTAPDTLLAIEAAEFHAIACHAGGRVNGYNVWDLNRRS
ncbi:hypothetical protein B0I35DRAFT_398048 [Stachybotrys elegans]|uniref:Zn(2)-C6 fungal-type domain-containing protein n=1 Tax=Stachybotrys elegans TaxID=80388 RepID=A0A8K0WMA7_9HYPO|nr:hypothetical protein B0I35DRAFT_398048 [Stachybotrys elegans]